MPPQKRTVEPALATLVTHAFAGAASNGGESSHHPFIFKILPAIESAIGELGVVSLNDLLKLGNSFGAGDLVESEIDEVAKLVYPKLLDPKPAWWKQEVPDGPVRDCWRVLILGARRVVHGGQPPAEDQVWRKLKEIGLRKLKEIGLKRNEQKIYPGLFCELAKQKHEVVKDLYKLPPSLRAFVAAETVALAKALFSEPPPEPPPPPKALVAEPLPPLKAPVGSESVSENDLCAFLFGARPGSEPRPMLHMSFPFLKGANLYLAKFERAVLSHADLSGAYAVFADFTDATMKFCECREADFAYAVLCSVNLTKAKVHGSNFYRTDLRGITLSGTTFSTDTSLKECLFDELRVPERRQRQGGPNWRKHAGDVASATVSAFASRLFFDGDDDMSSDDSDGDGEPSNNDSAGGEADTSIDAQLEALAKLVAQVFPKLEDLMKDLLQWFDEKLEPELRQFVSDLRKKFASDAAYTEERFLVDVRNWLRQKLFDPPDGQLPILLDRICDLVKPGGGLKDAHAVAPARKAGRRRHSARAVASITSSGAAAGELMGVTAAAELAIFKKMGDEMWRMLDEVSKEAENFVKRFVDVRPGCDKEKELIASLRVRLHSCLERGVQRCRRSARWRWSDGCFMNAMEQAVPGLARLAHCLDKLEHLISINKSVKTLNELAEGKVDPPLLSYVQGGPLAALPPHELTLISIELARTLAKRSLVSHCAPAGSLRRQLVKAVLRRATTYTKPISEEAGAWSLDWLRLAWRRSRRELVQARQRVPRSRHVRRWCRCGRSPPFASGCRQPPPWVQPNGTWGGLSMMSRATEL